MLSASIGITFEIYLTHNLSPKIAKMPLLSTKFSIPKIGLRKSNSATKNTNSGKIEEDLSTNIPDEITFAPGDHTMVFEDGQWVLEAEGVTGTYRDNSKLKEKLRKLEEENNLLRIKLEVVMDMLTETTAESHLQEKELQHLKTLIKSKKK